MEIMYCRRYQRVPFFCKATLTVLSAETAPHQYPRVPHFGTATAPISPGGISVDAYSFDISLGGVGLNAQVSCSRGCLVRVSFFLKGPDGERVEHVLGRVAYVRADESGTRVGIEFQEPVGESTHPELARRLQNL